MQGRSWMAALTLSLTLALVACVARPSHAADPPDPGAAPTPDAPPAPAAPDAAAPVHTVKLELRIAGLGTKGCDVEIKPGHPGCKFRTVNQHVDTRGYATVVVKDVVTRSADRDCTFAITIREAGQAERTVRRGLRLHASDAASGQLLTCYLSSPSRIARNNAAASAKR